MPEGLSPAQRRNYLLLLATVSLYFCGLSFMLLLPKYLKTLGAGESELGWLIGTPLIPFVLLSPYAGWLADRFSPKRLALAGIATALISGVGLLWVEEMSVFVYLLRLLHGAGHAFTFTPIFSMVAQSLSPEQKARGIAYFTVMVQLGNVAGSLLGALIFEHGGSLPFFVGSAALMAASWVVCLAVRDPGRAPRAAQPARYLDVVGERELWSGMVLILLLGGVFGMVLQFVPTYLDFLHAHGQAGAPIASYWYLTVILGTVALVRVALSNQIYRPGREQVLTLCMLGLPLAVLMLRLIEGPLSALLAAVALGVTYGLLFPAINAMVLVRGGSASQGAISGVLAMLYEVGFRGFGFVMGPVAEAYDYFTMFYLLAALLAVGVVAFFLLENDRRRWLPVLNRG